jgi:hypothetical protein
MRRWKNGCFVGVGVLALSSAIGSAWAWRATRHVPDFYQRALAVAPDELAKAATELETKIEKLEEEADEGQWQARFTSEQVNAWLARHLTREFPRLFPPGVSEPRVLLQGDRILAAARYQHRQWDTVVSIEATLHLTDHPNVLQINILRVAAGSLVLPLAPFTAQISRIAARSGLEVRWQDAVEQPAALVTVPCAHHQYDLRPMLLQTCEICDGAVIMSGFSGEEAIESIGSLPRDYRLALLQIHHE